MEGLSLNVWSLIPLHDGRTVARARAVCKTWYNRISRTPGLMRMFDIHFVEVKDGNLLEQEVLNGYNIHQSCLLTMDYSQGTEHCASILWQFNQFNLYTRRHKIQLYDNIFINFIAQFGWEGESFEFMLEQTTGDVFIVNNFYGRVDTWKSSRLDGMKFLKEQFKDTFDWRLIEFPFSPHGRFRVGKKEMYRGSLFLIRLKNRPNIITDVFAMSLNLKKRVKYDLSPIESAVLAFMNKE